MRDYLRFIDTHTPGPRCDVTPLFVNPQAFAELIADLCAPFPPETIDLVAGIDALGFILGAGMALRLGKGFLPIRKGGKLPVMAATEPFVDYTGLHKTLEVREDSLRPGLRVLLVDEWMETGAQMQAAVNLIERQGGVVAGIATINVDLNPLTARLRQTYALHSLWVDME